MQQTIICYIIKLYIDIIKLLNIKKYNFQILYHNIYFINIFALQKIFPLFKVENVKKLIYY